MTSVFTYGSLVVPEVWALVAGLTNPCEAGVLAGYRRRMLVRRPYPAITADPAENVRGILWHGVDSGSVASLDAFEGEIYQRLPVAVQAPGREVRAQAYVLRDEHRDLLGADLWDEARFRECELERYLEGCRDFAAERRR